MLAPIYSVSNSFGCAPRGTTEIPLALTPRSGLYRGS